MKKKKYSQVFFGVIAVIVVVLAVMRQLEVAKWPETQATIVLAEVVKETELESKKDSNGNKTTYIEVEYYVEIEYEFEVDGQVYRGDYETEDFESESYVERLRDERYSEGTLLTVKYDPEDPTDNLVHN
ncbi:DUF3592 domain-containing protein [Marinospirillum perlucidum]|uniref:DUF3592 domain-containing protein n=1 Tax=Marinospirillum perlucidum TaxID=1982602 RepID=UPI000DF3F02F|nr:DUF3592 domain-containing protein [Marinospirillum perlucidum]